MIGSVSGCVFVVDSHGQTIVIADAHRGDGQRFVVRADEKLTAFVELESGIREIDTKTKEIICGRRPTRFAQTNPVSCADGPPADARGEPC